MSILASPYVRLQLTLIKLKIINTDPGSRWSNENPNLDFSSEIRKFNYKYNINKHSDRELQHKNNKELS